MTAREELFEQKLKTFEKLFKDYKGHDIVFKPEQFLANVSMCLVDCLWKFIDELRLSRFYTEDELCDEASNCTANIEELLAVSVKKALDNDDRK